MNTQAILRLESQMGQLASQMSESEEENELPSHPESNRKEKDIVINEPGSSNEQVHALKTIQSGCQNDNQAQLLDVEEEIKEEEINAKNVASTKIESESKEGHLVASDLNPKSFLPKAPFHHMLDNSEKVDKDGDALDVFKEMESVYMIENWVFDGGGDELEKDFETLLREEVLDPKFIEKARGMLRMKQEEWEAEVNSFLISKLESNQEKAFDDVKLGGSFPFDPDILESYPIDSSFLKVSHTPYDSVFSYVELVEVICPLSSDLKPDLGYRSCEVSGWLNKHVHVVIIIYVDRSLDKYVFSN